VVVPEYDAAPDETDDPKPERPTYVNIGRIESNDDLRRSFLWGELRYLEGCLARTAIYSEMEPLREAAQQVRRSLRPVVEATVSVAD